MRLVVVFISKPMLEFIPDSNSKDSLCGITSQIVAAYNETNSMHHLNLCPLPNYAKVISISEDLKEVLFPGYRHRDRLNSANIVYHVGEIIDRLHDCLSIQIYRALCHGRKGGKHACNSQIRAELENSGSRKALAFLQMLPELRRILALDVEAAYAGDPACKSLAEVIFCYPGLEAVTIYRLAHALHELEVPLIPRMMSEWVHGKTGIDIHPGAKIGTHFFIDHGTGVVIGETCEIGNWVKLYQGVTLGALSFPKDSEGALIRGTKRHPTIEDNVIVYANATVLGGETVVGRGSVVGSSVWLTETVAPGTTVLIKPPELKLRVVGGQEQ